MKVLMINGSPNPNGNTAVALNTMKAVFEKNGIETEVVHVGNKDIRGCIGCRSCRKTGHCVFNDLVNETAKKFEEADGLVIGSPVYYANPNATLMAFVQRLFYSTPFDKTMKVGASVCAARRGGLESTYDAMNKYFGITGMPIASGQYWNGVYGARAGEANEDVEGLQDMRTLAENMSFMIKAIVDAKEKYGLPEKEPFAPMNFIR